MRTSVSLICIVLLGPVVALAQQASTGVITGRGTAILKESPELMRMHVVLTAKDKDLKEALTRLDDLKTAAQAQLGMLKAVGDSVVFETPQISSRETSEEQALQMMVMERMRGRSGPESSDSDEDKPIMVSVQLKADWALPDGELTAAMVFCHDLQKKVRDANLSGEKEKKELTPEEEEMMEEMAGMGYSRYGQTPQQKPGEPAFVFVRRVPDEQKSGLLAEAFGKAKADASALAKAAGVQLGSLKGLTYHVDSGEKDENPYRQYMYAAGYGSMLPPGDGDENEALAMQFGQVTYRVHINASFSIAE